MLEPASSPCSKVIFRPRERALTDTQVLTTCLRRAPPPPGSEGEPSYQLVWKKTLETRYVVA